MSSVFWLHDTEWTGLLPPTLLTVSVVPQSMRLTWMVYSASADGSAEQSFEPKYKWSASRKRPVSKRSARTTTSMESAWHFTETPRLMVEGGRVPCSAWGAVTGGGRRLCFGGILWSWNRLGRWELFLESYCRLSVSTETRSDMPTSHSELSWQSMAVLPNLTRRESYTPGGGEVKQQHVKQTNGTFRLAHAVLSSSWRTQHLQLNKVISTNNRRYKINTSLLISRSVYMCLWCLKDLSSFS